MTDDDYLRRVERERQRREDELLLILLLLVGRVRRDTLVALRHGFYTGSIAQSVLYTPAVNAVARTMAQAYRDGYRRVGLSAGRRDVKRSDAGTLRDIIAMYTTTAQRVAQATVDAVNAAIRDAVDAAAGGPVTRDALTSALANAGWDKSNTYSVDVGVERSVIGAHNDGLMAAMRVLSGVTGIRHVSVIDDATTDICRERHELQLPVDHPYWLRNIPSLHWRCRSTLRPLFGTFQISESLPVTQPMAGFGTSPNPFLPRRSEAA